MHHHAGTEVAEAILRIDRCAVDDGFRVFGDDLLVDVLRLAWAQRLHAFAAEVRFKADAVGLIWRSR